MNRSALQHTQDMAHAWLVCTDVWVGGVCEGGDFGGVCGSILCVGEEYSLMCWSDCVSKCFCVMCVLCVRFESFCVCVCFLRLV